MSEPVWSSEDVRALGATSWWRKKVLTEVSNGTFPPGTVFATPEGLRAEDEVTRAAFDVQGGVYPIRESVFLASYEMAGHTPSLEGATATTDAQGYVTSIEDSDA